jgi:restriction endonuclease S subunit
MSEENKFKTESHLRFPEFKNSGEWQLLPLGCKVHSISGYPFSGSDISEDDAGVPLLRGINITEGYIRHNPDIDRYFRGNIESLDKFKIQTGDLVIGMDGSKVGKNSALVTEYDSGALLVQRVARLRSENVNLIQYIFQQINSTTFHNYVDRVNTSSGIPHISLKQIESFEIHFPQNKEEQHKISDCLSSLVELITAEAQKLEALKVQKKGLMQQLFPTEGETAPELRFEEFRHTGEWKETKLEEIGEFKNGINFSPEKKGKGYLTVDVLNMYGQGIETRLDDLYRVDVADTDYFLRDGDILFVRSSLKREGVGWVSIFRNNNEPVLFCGFLIRLRVNSFKSTNPIYLGYYLRSEIGREKVVSLSGTGTITNVSQNSLKQITVPLPSTSEQQKIANCLSSLDEVITAQGDKIVSLKDHKKGLMQQLFPNTIEQSIPVTEESEELIIEV